MAEQNILPLGLVGVVAWSQVWPSHGDFLNNVVVGEYHALTMLTLITIFVISGMNLDVQDITAPSALRGFIVGLFSTLALTASVGFIAVKFPFDSPEYSLGLAIFCTSPTAPAFGLALVQQVRKNPSDGSSIIDTWCMVIILWQLMGGRLRPTVVTREKNK